MHNLSPALEFDNLEAVATAVQHDFIENNDRRMYYFCCELPVAAISVELHDVAEKARHWGAREKPEHLRINHGQYIKDGVDHIASELMRKPTSNRALFSLLGQDEISGKGDDPIPSFMIMQCGVEEQTLLCCVYFRALEVTEFFRVNLEEIRQKLVVIMQRVQRIKSVRLGVFAFRAYAESSIDLLEIPELDLLRDHKIGKILSSDKGRLVSLLRKKARHSTVINLQGEENLLYVLREDRPDLARAISLCEDLCLVAKELKELRSHSSHGGVVSEKSSRYRDLLGSLIDEIEANA